MLEESSYVSTTLALEVLKLSHLYLLAILCQSLVLLAVTEYLQPRKHGVGGDYHSLDWSKTLIDRRLVGQAEDLTETETELFLHC